jgi:hypothetical protein
MRRIGLAIGAVTLFGLVASASAQTPCVGDCNGDGMVSINELILGVNIALGLQPPSACPAFQNAQGVVDIAQLIKGVNNALNGCPSGNPTPTPTPTTGTDRIYVVDPGILLAPPMGMCTGSSEPNCTVSADCGPGKACEGNSLSGLFTTGLSGANASNGPDDGFAPGPMHLELGAPDANGVAQLRLTQDVDIPIGIVDGTCLCFKLLAAGGTGSVDCNGGTAYDTQAVRPAGSTSFAWTATSGLGSPSGPGDGDLLVMGLFERVMMSCAAADCPHHTYTDPPNLFAFTTTTATSVQQTTGAPLTLAITGGQPFDCAHFGTANSGGILAAPAPTTIDPIGDVSNVFRLGEKSPQ